MKTFLLHTLGCKVNQYESRQLRQVFERAGLSPAGPGQGADIVLVNTCCVTHIASSKSRQRIRRLLARHHGAALIVTGCLPVGQDDELGELAEKCLILKEKDRLPSLLNKILDDGNVEHPTALDNKTLNDCKIKDKTPTPQEIDAVSARQPQSHHDANSAGDVLPLLTSYHGQCRAFLKVQDGCDAYCTYCIIPKIRTKVCSKPLKNVIQEARNLIAAGHKEIILTGIFLGAYGRTTARRRRWQPEDAEKMAEMVAHVAALPGLARLRLSSLEPADVTDRLLEVFKTFDNIMPHLHLPLQSGSLRILRKMARQYTIEQFLDVSHRVKAALDRPAITTDIIVGFPGETDDDFEQTMDIAGQVGFSKIHVFSFSPRKNTAAAALEPKVPPAVIADRSARLQALDSQLQESFRRQFIGRPVQVVVESTRPPKGRCERYFMVDLSGMPGAAALKKGRLISTLLDR